MQGSAKTKKIFSIQDMRSQKNTMFESLFQYRSFIFSNVKREFQEKYNNSLLGVAWTVIHPLAMIVIYTVIFSKIMQARLPGTNSMFTYSIYLCSGIITWGFFSELINRSQGVFLEHANLIKKIIFPKICLPAIVLLNALINFSIIFSIFIIFLIISGNFPGFVIIYTIPVIIIQILFALGLGILLGVINVFFRDVAQFVAVLLQFWFWFTPIVYPDSIIPDQLRTLLYFNPMALLTMAYHDIYVTHTPPNFLHLIIVFFLSILICYLALNLFRNKVGEMVDEL